MATSITTNADLVDLEILTDYDIAQLTTARLGVETPPWATRHERAWTKILELLALRRPPVTEAELSTTTSLKYASCYYVAYLACEMGRSDKHAKMAGEFYAKFRREMNEVVLDATTGEAAGSMMRFLRSCRT